MVRTGLALGLLCSVGACGGGGSEQASPVLVETRVGTLRGVDDSAASGTHRWLGIPYAQAPVGALRWKAPLPASSWSGVRDAAAFGASCAQMGRFYSPPPGGAPYGLAVRDSFGKPVGSEDCLSLNIWRPASAAAASLPVIVFVHGGSNISGYSADPVYDGAQLAKAAHAVVVTVNYRLGLFGWLELAQLKTGNTPDDSGNFATLDLVEALSFVKNNIAAFGGDPANVTLAGQSAGAVNGWALLVSPLSEGLVHKAALFSGGLQFAAPAAARAYAEKLLAALLVADGTAADSAAAQAHLATRSASEVADYLRGKTAEQILQVQIANAATLGSFPANIADGSVLPASAAAAIAAGQYRKLPLLMGNTRDEGKLYGPFKLSDHDRFTAQFEFDPNAPTTLAEADFLLPSMLPADAPASGWNAVSANITNGVFVAGSNATLAVVSPQQSKLWVYRFDWDEQPAPFGTVYGAAHGSDLAFWFGNFGPSILSFGFSQANRPGREALSAAMTASLAALAKNGDPQHAGLGLQWSPWPKRLVLDADPARLQLKLE